MEEFGLSTLHNDTIDSVVCLKELLMTVALSVCDNFVYDFFFYHTACEKKSWQGREFFSSFFFLLYICTTCSCTVLQLFSGPSIKKEPQSPGSGSSGQGYNTPARSTDEYDPELPTDDSASGKNCNSTTKTFFAEVL